MKCTALIGSDVPAACDVPGADWLSLAGGSTHRDSGLPGSGLAEEGGNLAVCADLVEDPRWEAASPGQEGWQTCAAAEEAVRIARDRGRHGGTMAPQNLGTFCLLLLYLIGAVIAG